MKTFVFICLFFVRTKCFETSSEESVEDVTFENFVDPTDYHYDYTPTEYPDFDYGKFCFSWYKLWGKRYKSYCSHFLEDLPSVNVSFTNESTDDVDFVYDMDNSTYSDSTNLTHSLLNISSLNETINDADIVYDMDDSTNGSTVDADVVYVMDNSTYSDLYSDLVNLNISSLNGSIDDADIVYDMDNSSYSDLYSDLTNATHSLLNISSSSTFSQMKSALNFTPSLSSSFTPLPTQFPTISTPTLSTSRQISTSSTSSVHSTSSSSDSFFKAAAINSSVVSGTVSIKAYTNTSHHPPFSIRKSAAKSSSSCCSNISSSSSSSSSSSTTINTTSSSSSVTTESASISTKTFANRSLPSENSSTLLDDKYFDFMLSGYDANLHPSHSSTEEFPNEKGITIQKRIL